MASITLTRTTAPYLSGSVATVGTDTAIAINYPSGLRRLSVRPATNAGEGAPSGTEGDALGADKHPLDADAWLAVEIKPEGGTVFAQSSVSPTTFYALGELL